MESKQPWGKNTEQLLCPQQVSYPELPIEKKKRKEEVSTEHKMKDLKQPQHESCRCRLLGL